MKNKKLIAWAIILHILPLLFLVVYLLSPEETLRKTLVNPPWLYYYLLGWAINIAIPLGIFISTGFFTLFNWVDSKD